MREIAPRDLRGGGQVIGRPALIAKRKENMDKYLIIFTLFLGGCASMNIPSSNPELHVIGVYEGYDKHKKASKSSQILSMSSSYSGKGHGVAMYRQSTSSDSTPTSHNTKNSIKGYGEVIVNISKTDAPLILAFSAYDRTKWIVNAKENVKIEKVILSGYHQQIIEGINEGTLIEVYTHDSSTCEYCYQGQGYFYSYDSPPTSKLKQLTGLDISSWQGKYSGKEFSIFNNIPTLSK